MDDAGSLFCKVHFVQEWNRTGSGAAKAQAVATDSSSGPIYIFGGGDKCHRCSKSVFANERALADDLVFHKSCFRCAECATMLRQNNWELSPGGVLLCKTHYT